jgi:hypothetical protein
MDNFLWAIYVTDIMRGIVYVSVDTGIDSEDGFLFKTNVGHLEIPQNEFYNFVNCTNVLLFVPPELENQLLQTTGILVVDEI